MFVVKQLHVICAAISIFGFILRGYWMLRGSTLLHRRWVRIAPHIVDTALLVTGITMVMNFRLYPTDQPWLAAKLVALVIYIVLGSIALKRGKTPRIRAAAFVSALVVFAYIVVAALHHSPLPGTV